MPDILSVSLQDIVYARKPGMQKITVQSLISKVPSSNGILKNWHRFKSTGALFLLDVLSGSLHMLDEMSWNLIGALEQADRADALERFSSEYGSLAVEEILEDLNTLIEDGSLSDPDEADPNVDLFENGPRHIKAMCIHIAHDCNMRCGYCFAGMGGFGGQRVLMKAEVGKAALDFLFKSSGHIRHLEVDFFGGEPLMNFDAVKEIVEYGKELERKYDKVLKFTMTTNVLAMDDSIGEYLNQNDMATVLSIDGRKEVHDAVRRTEDGGPTFETILENAKRFVKSRDGEDYYVRGTYTVKNKDFSNDVLFMADQGFKRISFEPVVADDSSPYAIKDGDLPEIFEEYDRLSTEMVKRSKAGDGFSFFHFDMDVAKGPCIKKRLSGCGAGAEYVAVTPEGDIYPCHQFVGRPEFKMGDVFNGINNEDVGKSFSNANIQTKEGCSDCWARYYCSGGCHANAFLFGGDIFKPYEMGCKLTKKRLETALGYQALK